MRTTSFLASRPADWMPSTPCLGCRPQPLRWGAAFGSAAGQGFSFGAPAERSAPPRRR